MDGVRNSRGDTPVSGFLIMDNDSGYVSNNLDQESNSDSVTETLNNSSVEILKSFLPKSIYISEDALLERPDFDQTISDVTEEENTHYEAWNSDHVNNTMNSSNAVMEQAALSKFDTSQSDSGSSTKSIIVPVAKPIYYNLNKKVNTSPPLSNEGENISSNLSDGPFFGFENVPMEGTNQIFQNNINICTNEYIDDKTNSIFEGLFSNDTRTNLSKSIDATMECFGADKEVHNIPKEESTTTVVEYTTSDIEIQKSITVVETPNNFRDESDVVKEDSLINIEELPIFIEEYPSEDSTSTIRTSLTALKMIELNHRTPIQNNIDNISSVEDNHAEKDSSLQILKDCNETDCKMDVDPVDEQTKRDCTFVNDKLIECKNSELSNVSAMCSINKNDTVETKTSCFADLGMGSKSSTIEESSRSYSTILEGRKLPSAAAENSYLTIDSSADTHKARRTSISKQEVAENKVLTNLTNISVCDISEAGPSKISMIQRRNSTKNKENVTETEVFKTPSKCRKRKFSEVESPCDLFSDSESSTSKPLASPKVIEERFVHKYDHRLIKRVQKTLSGVPPPPDLTTTKLTVDDILEKLEANKNLFWTRDNLNQVMSENFEKEKTLLNESHNSSLGSSCSILIDGLQEEAVKKDFPDILYSRHHGLHYNRSKLSEEIEHLCDKYARRYVGAETQSTCSAVETEHTSPGKRRTIKPKWAVKSPGRRLSHLAKRRITFSSASLQAGTSSSAASRARQILIDYKKLELLNKRMSPKKSPKKTPMRSPMVSPGNGRTPSSSAKKKLRMRFRLLSGDFKDLMAEQNSNASNSKRALFQSPDKASQFRNNLPSSSSAMNSFERDLASGGGPKRSLFSSPNKVSCRTSLFPSPSDKKSLTRSKQNFEKKRKRDEDDENILNQPKFFRSQSSYAYSEGEPKAGSSLTRAKSESVLMNSQIMTELSAANKKKLQWAVYDSLKDQNITTSHPQFKVFASVLARVIRRCIVSSNIRLESSGTSEKMLRIARHHVYAVVKGKSVDEIMSEVNKNKAKLIKPRGYVAPQDYNPHSTSKDFVLRDRDINNGDSVTKNLSSQNNSAVKAESRIDRIRKVINFEDNR